MVGLSSSQSIWRIRRPKVVAICWEKLLIVANMGMKTWITQSTLGSYARVIRNAPREVIFNRNLIFSAMIYAMCGIPQTWDQGSSAVITTLEGYQDYFGLTSGASASQIRELVSIIYIGYAIGAALSFIINDRIGRLWSFRLYTMVWILGQLVAIFSPNLSALWASRIVSGIGIGSLTATGPMSLVEISPPEVRGLLTTWYPVTMGIALLSSNFCVYGIYLHLPTSRIQYQIVWFAPCVFMLLCALASFFICESPRWLLLANRRTEAVNALVRLRGLPANHERVQFELNEIEDNIEKSRSVSSFKAVAKETFLVRSNQRRLQQILISYALAQLSGANSVTSYFIPIMNLVGQGGDTARSIFLSGMYALCKLFFSLFASFFFIDALGRRKSLFVGVSVQMVSHIYIGAYIKSHQEGQVSTGASQGAIAAIFIHAFGYAVGLLVLPYVFGSELWPNRIRSFGVSVGSTFHWIFIYGMKFSVPSLLESTNNWGAFIFFAGWCFLALIYVFFMVPEVACLSVEEIEELFRGPWFKAYKTPKQSMVGIDIQAAEVLDVQSEYDQKPPV